MIKFEDVLKFAKNLKFRTKNFGGYGLSLFDREILKWLSILMTRNHCHCDCCGQRLWDLVPVFQATRSKANRILHAQDFSRPLSKLRVVGRNSDWFIALFPPVVIGRWNYFGKSLESRSVPATRMQQDKRRYKGSANIPWHWYETRIGKILPKLDFSYR